MKNIRDVMKQKRDEILVQQRILERMQQQYAALVLVEPMLTEEVTEGQANNAPAYAFAGLDATKLTKWAGDPAPTIKGNGKAWPE